MLKYFLDLNSSVIFNTCAMESIPDDGVGPKNRTIDVNRD